MYIKLLFSPTPTAKQKKKPTLISVVNIIKPYANLILNTVWYNDLVSYEWTLKSDFPWLKDSVATSHGSGQAFVKQPPVGQSLVLLCHTTPCDIATVSSLRNSNLKASIPLVFSTVWLVQVPSSQFSFVQKNSNWNRYLLHASHCTRHSNQNGLF